MRNPGGYAEVIGPSDRVHLGQGRDPLRCEGVGRIEFDTFTCKHCQRITIVQVRARPEDIGGLCKQCMGLICPTCYADGRCTPLERRLEAQERRHEALRSYGLT